MSKQKRSISPLWLTFAVLFAGMYWLWTQTTLLSQQMGQNQEIQKISMENSALLSQQKLDIDRIEQAQSALQKQHITKYLQSEQVIELIALADRRFTVNHDPAGAVQALTLAQQTISPELKEAWHGLSLSINTHIETLSHAKNTIQSQLLEINQLSEAISSLPLTTEKMPDQPKRSTSPEAGNWKARSKDMLKKLIVVRHLDGPPNRHNTPEQLQMLRQRALLNLDLARWGILQHEPDLTRSALQTVKHIVSIQIQFSKETREAAIHQVDKLLAQQPTEPLPNLTQLIHSAQQLQSTLLREVS